jgi:hypothetical protein
MSDPSAVGGAYQSQDTEDVSVKTVYEDETMGDAPPLEKPYESQDVEPVPVEPVYENEQVGSSDIQIEKAFREARSNRLKKEEDKLKKITMEKDYDTAYKQLQHALGGKNGSEFLGYLEDMVYDGEGSLDDYYKEVAKLDALKWLDRHKESVLDLNLPDKIVLTFPYDFASQPEILTEFFNNAKTLVEGGNSFGKRRGSETPSKETAGTKRQRKKEKKTRGRPSVNEDALQEAVKSNQPIRTVYAELGDFLGRHADPEDFLRKHHWFSGGGEKQVFKVSKPTARGQKKFNIEERLEDEKDYKVPEEKNVELDQVFGVIRMKLWQEMNSRVFFRFKEDPEIYRVAKVYWEKRVQEEANSKAKPSWSDNYNVTGVKISLQNRAYHTPWIKKDNDKEVTITYVTKGGEVDTQTFPKIDANVSEAKPVGADEMGDLLG